MATGAERIRLLLSVVVAVLRCGHTAPPPTLHDFSLFSSLSFRGSMLDAKPAADCFLIRVLTCAVHTNSHSGARAIGDKNGHAGRRTNMRSNLDACAIRDPLSKSNIFIRVPPGYHHIGAHRYLSRVTDALSLPVGLLGGSSTTFGEL